MSEKQNYRQEDRVDTAADSQQLPPELSLDDERRIKVLSPGMLVFRRFIRNRLALVGVGILIFMFIFSFFGGFVSPYRETEQFTTDEMRMTLIGGIVANEEMRYSMRNSNDFPTLAQAYFAKALNNRQSTFEARGVDYSINPIGEEAYAIATLEPLATAEMLGRQLVITPVQGAEMTDELETAFRQAQADGTSEFDLDGDSYEIIGSRRTFELFRETTVAVASKNVLDFADHQEAADREGAFLLHLALEKALAAEEREIDLNGRHLVLEERGDDDLGIYAEGELFATYSDFIVQPVNPSLALPLEFKDEALLAAMTNEKRFSYALEDVEEEFELERQDARWSIRRLQATRIFHMYAPPSSAHWLGTDGNGMDMLTRLMYGGRVSLLIGFIVVAISLLIGVVLGGLSGYFGGWVDMVVMRLVDVSYCIPTMPILIIFGHIMDQLKMPSGNRLRYLMIVLGILGWSSIARLVRGQILSLREQEFMTAAEATGISVSRRIFRHLVPNVIPQLIVIATMSLGSTILTESTLSFLGLGVKFPYATWGNIINSVNNVFVMTNYWYAWIPAGLCILITVLAFNFVGDGLRDAFDPKMKR